MAARDVHRASESAHGTVPPRPAVAGLLCLAIALGALTGCTPPTPPPDVVVLTLDTLNRNYTPMAGRRDLMPALAELLDESASFPVAHTQVPLTLPSHTSMFSGQAPLEHGVLLNNLEVKGDLPLLAGQLRDAGYETAAFVSFGVLGPETGIARGFETYDTGDARPHRYRRAPQTLERVERFLARRADDRPLFLWVHLADPHLPYLERELEPDVQVLGDDGTTLAELTLADRALHRVELPPDTESIELRALEPVTERLLRRMVIREVRVESSEGQERTLDVVPLRLRASRPTRVLDLPPARALHLRGDLVLRGRRDLLRRYRSEVQLMDDGIGRLRAAAASHLDDDALWAVVSDHGEGAFEHGVNGHAAHAWEEQLAVLFAIRTPPSWSAAWPTPEALPRAQVEDLAPTLLDLLGIERPESTAISHADCLRTGTGCRSRSRWAAYAADRSTTLSAAAVYDWPLKGVWRAGKGTRCHDLVADPDERNPLPTSDPACAALIRTGDNFRFAVEPMLSAGIDPAQLTAEQRSMLESLGYL